ncbi:universal stress protein [Sphaerisporangium fuscum]|uniref:universal stress protein n=1 Tax=Sphaerisporangium fuscum TaxID=2835868 RepID=UPI001BDBCA6D|nr:universal stress protein [Sphaerisporangium fuscum]
MLERIVVGADGSAPATAAVEWAAGDAARWNVPLHIVTVVERWPYSVARFPAPPEVGDALIRAAERVLAQAEAAARDRLPEGRVTTELAEGVPAEILRERAEGAVELVVGSRGHGGFAGALLGSVSGHVAGHARGPVVVVRPGAPSRHGEVAVGVDDAPQCDPALAYAFGQARLRGAVLRAVHAWRSPVHAYAPELDYDMDEIRRAQHEVVTRKLGELRGEYPDVKVVDDVRCAHPVDALVEASRHADLLVVGSHGRGTLGALLLGSVSRGALHHAACPVAVVRE